VNLVAFDVATGRRRWSSPTIRARSDDHPEITVDRDVVYVATEGSVLRAYDRTNGRPRWWAHPSYCDPRLWRVGPEESIVVCTAGDLYARGAEPRQVRQLAVSGRITVEQRPRARVVVRVGSEWSVTDAGGRYRARVRAWDDVPVRVDCDACGPASRELPIDGPATRTLDLDLEGLQGGVVDF
jgi:outer membrane protein assembly factor BamB